MRGRSDPHRLSGRRREGDQAARGPGGGAGRHGGGHRRLAQKHVQLGRPPAPRRPAAHIQEAASQPAAHGPTMHAARCERDSHCGVPNLHDIGHVSSAEVDVSSARVEMRTKAAANGARAQVLHAGAAEAAEGALQGHRQSCEIAGEGCRQVSCIYTRQQR